MLRAKQRKLILALVQSATVRAACKRVNVNERTYRRWRKDPSFMAALAACRNEAFDDAVGVLKGALPRASRALVRCLKGGRPADVIRAARTCFDVVRDTDLADIEAQVAELRATLTKRREEQEQ